MKINTSAKVRRMRRGQKQFQATVPLWGNPFLWLVTIEVR
jgi:hypothetical protein